MESSDFYFSNLICAGRESDDFSQAQCTHPIVMSPPSLFNPLGPQYRTVHHLWSHQPPALIIINSTLISNQSPSHVTRQEVLAYRHRDSNDSHQEPIDVGAPSSLPSPPPPPPLGALISGRLYWRRCPKGEGPLFLSWGMLIDKYKTPCKNATTLGGKKHSVSHCVVASLGRDRNAPRCSR